MKTSTLALVLTLSVCVVVAAAGQKARGRTADFEKLPDRRTSLVVDPADGRVPPLTSQARARLDALTRSRKEHHADNPEDLPLSERCLLWGADPPLVPVSYNNNLQIIQTRDHVMILTEMVHDARVIPLDGRPHLPAGIHQWKGDSRGHWDGDTLVVDTTNYTDSTRFQGSGTGLHVVERFTLGDRDLLRYDFTVDDPAAFARPWSGRLWMRRTTDRIYEYACHEGNYSMPGILRGARFGEKDSREVARFIPGAAPGQTLVVLHIKVTLTDAARASMPVPSHALLISDNPATSTPRRVVTASDGAANVSLGPGNYTVESDEAVAFEGKGYQWTQTVEITAGRDVILELTSANAVVGSAPAPSASPATGAKAPSPILPRWKDSIVSVWTPGSRASGFLVDAAGLVVTSQRVIGSASAVEVQLTPLVKVAARVLVADRVRDIAVLWIDPGTIGSVTPIPLNCSDASKPHVADGQNVVAVGGPFPGQRDASLEAVVSVDDVCAVVRSAEQVMQTTQPPVATRLPVEPLQKIPADTLAAAVQRGKVSLSSYQMSSSDFDIVFLTPVLVYGAQHNTRQVNTRGAEMPQGRQIVPTDFGDWSNYFADVPPVLVIRVTPKFAESFWTTVARGAAYTQGMALPPIKHFKPGFSRLRALCGDVEVTPIHPFTLEQRVSETDAVHEGLYVFDPQALGPHCRSVTLVLYSEKEPAKPDTRVVDPQVIERIWKDFAPYRIPPV